MKYIKYEDKYFNVEKISEIYIHKYYEHCWEIHVVSGDAVEIVGEYNTCEDAQRALNKFMALQEADIFEFED